MRRFDFKKLLLVVLTGALLTGCVGRDAAGNGVEISRKNMRYAEHLSMIPHEGYTEVVVRNPWDTLRTLRRYYLVDRDSVVPPGLSGGVVVRTPVKSALVYSTVHTGLISELGKVDAISGVCSAEHIKTPGILEGLKSGMVTDCGNNMNPDVEKIIMLHPEAILLSPYENNDRYTKVETLGIPLVECADYVETSPLGRAEWIKFYALLMGAEAKGDSIFRATERSYLNLKDIASKAENHPEVLIDQPYGQTWSVAGKNSTMGKFISDAGGTNPFNNFEKNGSTEIAPEKVLGMAHDADLWLLRYNQDKEKTLEELKRDAHVNSRFEAIKRGNVYGCNTRYSDFYEAVPFHPDRLLRDMIIIMHPGVLGDVQPVYYHKMK